MRIGEIAHDFRYESSGTLKGIERGRHFCQNDAHLFCTPEREEADCSFSQRQMKISWIGTGSG